MKKLFALAALFCLMASVSFAQLVGPPDGPSNQYDATYTKDYTHGKPGNPYNDPLNSGAAYDYWQYDSTTNPSGTLFMWQFNTAAPTRPDDGQSQDYYSENCLWQDIPEYVGCTQYFYLFVYQPLEINCNCESYLCLGIYTIPSYHQLWDPQTETSFPGNDHHIWCAWTIYGQKNWDVTLSGEILEDGPTPNEVTVNWEWVGDQTATYVGNIGAISGAGFIETSDNWTRGITLDDTGFYYVGLIATDVTVSGNAQPGVYTYDATLSGFYTL